MAGGVIDKIVAEVARMVGDGGAKSSRHDATVLRRDDSGTLWVHIDGGAEETPVNGSSYADVSAGDTVRVEISGGRCALVGNASAPAVGIGAVRDTVAQAVEQVTEAVGGRIASVSAALEAAAKVASEAKAVADATGQHVWSDASGEHVTEVEREAWEDEASADYHGGSNILLNALGILLRDGLDNLTSVTKSAVAFFDGLGSEAANIVAQFGRDGARIGYANAEHVSIGDSSVTFTGEDGETETVRIDSRTTTVMSRVLTMTRMMLNNAKASIFAGQATAAFRDGTVNQLHFSVGEDGDPVWIKMYESDLDEQNMGEYPHVAIKGNVNVVVDDTEATTILLEYETGRIVCKKLEIGSPLEKSYGGTGMTDLGRVLTKDVSAAVSVESGTWTDVGSLALPAGTWVISYGLTYHSNATGRRYLCLYNGAGAPSAGWRRATCVSVAALNGGNTEMHSCWITSGGMTIHLKAWQGSGSALDVTGNIRAVKVG